MATNQVFSKEKNPRGIPKAPFIADIEAHLGGPDVSAEGPMRDFQTALAKYRYMDSNLTQRRLSLEQKIPDIKKTLAMVVFLRDSKAIADGDSESKPIRTTFELNDTLFAEAELEDTDDVYLWLGANVMLSYKIPTAITLLNQKLASAESALGTVIEDLEFLREQLTIMEVNTARLYNWDVKRRREKKESEGGKKAISRD